jgi:AcrR family transcriptional regulator
MPRAFSDHEKDLIRRRLLEQSFKLFSTYGLKKTSIEEIARAAGISKGAFYIFYDSKEELFMEVVEQAEQRVRQDLLAVVDLPGPSARARLLAVLKKAYSLFESMPILKYFTGSDFDRLFRTLPPEKLQEHLVSDRAFLEALISRCQLAGIPIQVQPEQLTSLLYPLVLAIMHDDGLGRELVGNGLDLLLELVAAFCLGEIELLPDGSTSPIPASGERLRL